MRALLVGEHQQLLQAPPTFRPALADAIARMAPVSWQHINLQREVDFAAAALRFDPGAVLPVE